MSAANTNQIMNHLLVLHDVSPVCYLCDAGMAVDNCGVNTSALLVSICNQQRDLADRIAALIRDNGGAPRRGEFPLSYSAWHDLSAAYLVKQLLASQKNIVAEISGAIERLSLVPFARGLAEEALGVAKGHLQSLRELK